MNRFRLKRILAGRGTKQILGSVLSGSSVETISSSIKSNKMYVLGQEGDLLGTDPVTADLNIYSEELFLRKYSIRNPDIDTSQFAYDLQVQPTTAGIIDGIQFNDYSFYLTEETNHPTKYSTSTNRNDAIQDWFDSKHEVVTYFPFSGDTSGSNYIFTEDIQRLVTTTDYTYWVNQNFSSNLFPFSKQLAYNIDAGNILDRRTFPNTSSQSLFFSAGNSYGVNCELSGNLIPISGDLVIEFDFNLKNTSTFRISPYTKANPGWWIDSNGILYNYEARPYESFELNIEKYNSGIPYNSIWIKDQKLYYKKQVGTNSKRVLFPEISGVTLDSQTNYNIKLSDFTNSSYKLTLTDNNSNVYETTAVDAYTQYSTTDLISKINIKVNPNILFTGPILEVVQTEPEPTNPDYTYYVTQDQFPNFNGNYIYLDNFKVRDTSIITKTETQIVTLSSEVIDPENPGRFDINKVIDKTPLFLGDNYALVFGEINGSQITTWVKDVSTYPNTVYALDKYADGLPFAYLFETPMDASPYLTNANYSVVFGETYGPSASLSAFVSYTPLTQISGYGTLYSQYTNNDDSAKIYYNPFKLKNMYDGNWQTRIDQNKEILEGVRDYTKIGKSQETIWLSYYYYHKDYPEISPYQMVERFKGLYKYRPNEGHKSNIYSIRINNSGLNEALSGGDIDSGVLSGYPVSEIKKDLKSIIENAVHDAVKRIVPSHTQLWKIDYTGT